MKIGAALFLIFIFLVGHFAYEAFDYLKSLGMAAVLTAIMNAAIFCLLVVLSFSLALLVGASAIYVVLGKALNSLIGWMLTILGGGFWFMFTLMSYKELVRLASLSYADTLTTMIGMGVLAVALACVRHLVFGRRKAPQ